MPAFDLRRAAQSSEEIEVLDVFLNGDRVGILKAYKASEEEAKMIKTKLKRKVKTGDVYSLRVIFKSTPASDDLLTLDRIVDERYPSLPGKKYFLVEKDGELIRLPT